METRRNFLTVVSTTTVEEDGYDSYTLDDNIRALSFDDLIKEDWFLEKLKENGFFHKDDLSELKINHLDNYIYKIKRGQYAIYTEKIDSIYPHEQVVGVYQEVVGPERIRAYAKFKKSHEAYEKKQEELKLAKLAKQKLAKEKCRLREIEKAKRILAEAKLETIN